MKSPEDDKWLDEALTDIIGSEETRTDFKQWKQKHPQAVEMLTSRAQPKSTARTRPPILRNTIMKNPITKLAAAAAMIVAVILSANLWDRSAPSAYAVEQTIEAMRSIRSVHAYCTDWDDSRGEVWVQIDPETGLEEYSHADIGNLVIVGTPQATYYYYKDKNLVRIRNEYVPASEIRFSSFFEDIVGWVQQYNGKLTISSKYDDDLKREVILVHVTVPAQADFGEMEFVVDVDIQTKPPLSVRKLKGKPGQGVKSVDRIEYNVTIPKGTFEFQIPEGARVIYENKDERD